jgi:hypothetical protein
MKYLICHIFTSDTRQQRTWPIPGPTEMWLGLHRHWQLRPEQSWIGQPEQKLTHKVLHTPHRHVGLHKTFLTCQRDGPRQLLHRVISKLQNLFTFSFSNFVSPTFLSFLPPPPFFLLLPIKIPSCGTTYQTLGLDSIWFGVSLCTDSIARWRSGGIGRATAWAGGDDDPGQWGVPRRGELPAVYAWGGAGDRHDSHAWGWRECQRRRSPIPYLP